jgi:AraC-like DNA-binding protein
LKRNNVSSSSLLQKMPLRETTTATREPWAPLHFSTRSMPKAEQFGGWRDFVAAAVELTLIDAPIEGFEAEQDIWNLGRLVLASARMPGRGYVRSWHHLTRDPLDHWCLVLCEGATPGTRGPLSFRSLARPFFGGGADGRVLTLFVPRDLFASRSSAFDSSPPDIPDTGLGALLADYLLSLERQLPQLIPEEIPRVAEATRAMLLACIAPTSASINEASAPLLQTARKRARRVIQRNLHASSLAPAMLCRSVGISRSGLYRLFEGDGGVTHYIQRQRLLGAFAALSDLNDTRAIAQIAEAFGFPSASGFSRAFRREFDLSPGDARAAAHSGHPCASVPAEAARVAAGDLGAILRSLQV